MVARVLRVRRRRVGVALIAAVAVTIGLSASRAYSHPLHTTLSELTVAPDGRIAVVMRAFVDDLSATPSDSAVARYLRGAVTLTDPSGKGAPVEVVSVRRSGDLIWITLSAPAGRVAATRLTNCVLFDRYDDQVNIVRTSVAGRRRTLLFTKRDGSMPKAF